MKKMIEERDTTDDTVVDPMVGILDRKWGDLRAFVSLWDEADDDESAAETDHTKSELIADILASLSAVAANLDNGRARRIYKYQAYGILLYEFPAETTLRAIITADEYARNNQAAIADALASSGFQSSVTFSPIACYVEDALADVPMCAEPVQFHDLLAPAIAWITDPEAVVRVTEVGFAEEMEVTDAE